jgi:hypothetical protein
MWISANRKGEKQAKTEEAIEYEEKERKRKNSGKVVFHLHFFMPPFCLCKEVIEGKKE